MLTGAGAGTAASWCSLRRPRMLENTLVMGFWMTSGAAVGSTAGPSANPGAGAGASPRYMSARACTRKRVRVIQEPLAGARPPGACLRVHARESVRAFRATLARARPPGISLHACTRHC